jgi:chemotaxis protein histidine kinase CheA
LPKNTSHRGRGGRGGRGGKGVSPPNDQQEELDDQHIKEIEESSWFKRFYKNAIKPTTDKIYDIFTSDEAITAAKITAQILILSLLMYAANEAKGAMYNYIGRPTYDRIMRSLNNIRESDIHSDIFTPNTILTDMPKNREMLELIDAYDPTPINKKFRSSKGRLDRMIPENRRLYFEKNPASKMKKYFENKIEFKDSDEIEAMRDELAKNASSLATKEEEIAMMQRKLDEINEDKANEDRQQDEARMMREAKQAESDEGLEMFFEDLRSHDLRMLEANQRAERSRLAEKANHDRASAERDRLYRAELNQQAEADAIKRQKKAEKDAKKAKELEEFKAEFDRKESAKKAAKKAAKKKTPPKGNGLSTTVLSTTVLSKYKAPGFYKFIVSDDAKSMAKKTVVGLITTVLTILASQHALHSEVKGNKKIMIHSPTITSKDDLSYYGIPYAGVAPL